METQTSKTTILTSSDKVDGDRVVVALALDSTLLQFALTPTEAMDLADALMAEVANIDQDVLVERAISALRSIGAKS